MIVKSPTINHSTSESNLHNILATVCYPVNKLGFTDKYDDKLHNKIADDIYNHMDIEDIFNVSSFFLQYFQQFLTTTENYLVYKSKKLIAKAEKELKVKVMN